MSQLRDTNAFIQHHKPWELKQDVTSRPWLDTILYVTMETLRVTGILLQPIVPNLSRNLLQRISVKSHEKFFDCLDSLHFLKNQESPYTGRTLGQGKKILFQKIKS